MPSARSKGFLNLRQFISCLRAAGELVDIYTPVDPNLELAEIHRQTVAQNGPALLFHSVQNSSFSVVSNLFGSEKRLMLALGEDIFERIDRCVAFFTSQENRTIRFFWNHRHLLKTLLQLGTKNVFKAPLCTFIENPDLDRIPFLRQWPEDGGFFLTLPLVYTEDVDQKIPNMGIYRMQRFSKTTAGLHWQIGKGGAFHYDLAEKQNLPLPVSIFLGGPPALTLSAIAPLPENMSEILLASFFCNRRIEQIRLPQIAHKLFAHAELALFGHAYPRERMVEGPFGDHYGYQDPSSLFPVFHATHMLHTHQPIIPATVVGPPMQEDGYIGSFLQKLFLPALRTCIPSIIDLHTYPETGFHSLCAARVKERYGKESLSTALRILGEGQLSLTKILLCIQEDIPLFSIKKVLFALLTHLRPEDIYILPQTATDSLDPTAPYRNKGSKLLLLGTSSQTKTLPIFFSTKHPLLRNSIPYVPGCLVIDGPSYKTLKNPTTLLKNAAFHSWPLLILVDDAYTTCASEKKFLWHCFTRFNPSTDIYFSDQTIEHNSIKKEFPLLIDARLKPTVQKPLMPDPEIVHRITARKNDFYL